MARCCADRVDGSRGGLAEQMLELGGDLFDQVKVGRVFWQEEQLGADGTDDLANALLLSLSRLSKMMISPGRRTGRRTFSM